MWAWSAVGQLERSAGPCHPRPAGSKNRLDEAPAPGPRPRTFTHRVEHPVGGAFAACSGVLRRELPGTTVILSSRSEQLLRLPLEPKRESYPSLWQVTGKGFVRSQSPSAGGGRALGIQMSGHPCDRAEHLQGPSRENHGSRLRSVDLLTYQKGRRVAGWKWRAVTGWGAGAVHTGASRCSKGREAGSCPVRVHQACEVLCRRREK